MVEKPVPTSRRLRLILLFLACFAVLIDVLWTSSYYGPSSSTTTTTLTLDFQSTQQQQRRCHEIRGTEGSWYRNETMGRNHFYAFGFRSGQWKRHNSGKGTAVYPGNVYAWKDATSCQITRPVDRDTFCDTMNRLQIKRILMVGDSLTQSQLESLVSMTGYDAGEFVKVSRKSELKRSAIDCPRFNLSIPIHFRRENLGPNLRSTNITGRQDATRDHRQQFGPEIPYCVDSGAMSNAAPAPTLVDGRYYCPWHKLYNESNAKTLLLLNQGAHFHSVETFSNSFDLFVDTFNAMAHPGDIIMFRSTVPGHRDCFHNTIGAVNMTHDKFLQRYATTMYDWNLFETYNAYAKEEFATKITQRVTAHYLNVYNMTILRPDQHAAADDCLHYTHPGPVDFWNHLMLTNLEEIAQEQQEL